MEDNVIGARQTKYCEECDEVYEVYPCPEKHVCSKDFLKMLHPLKPLQWTREVPKPDSGYYFFRIGILRYGKVSHTIADIGHALEEHWYEIGTDTEFDLPSIKNTKDRWMEFAGPITPPEEDK